MMSTLWKAAAAGLGVALVQEYVTPRLPASVATLAGGTVAKFGMPILGAAAGLFVEKMINK